MMSRPALPHSAAATPTPIVPTAKDSTGVPPLSIGQCATLACLLEATAPKVGNVHRGADFEDLSFTDFVVSAVAIAPAMESAERVGVGAACLEAVRATRARVSTNTNLGICLLLAPLAAVPRTEPIASGIARVLDTLSDDDSRLVYEAIRMANPGGLGSAESMDVRSGEAPPRLLDAMRAAADRDLVARQYADRFRLVLEFFLPRLAADCAAGLSLIDAIIHSQVEFLSVELDTLIVRKCGPEMGERVREFAAAVLRAGPAGSERYHQALGDFDFWLRADGHRRNPGATADLIAAALFVALREGQPWASVTPSRAAIS
jgi:triphosphoribosyl-dephospho-CoA synthase